MGVRAGAGIGAGAGAGVGVGVGVGDDDGDAEEDDGDAEEDDGDAEEDVEYSDRKEGVASDETHCEGAAGGEEDDVLQEEVGGADITGEM